LGWIYLICRFEGYFHLGAEIAYNGDFTEALARQLDYWPMDQPLPIVLYRKFTNTCSPPFRWGLVKGKRGGNGWGVFPIFMESKGLNGRPAKRKPSFKEAFLCLGSRRHWAFKSA
jgi:hypothetical protein